MLSLAIVTPEEQVLAIEADEVVAPGANGEVGFLPGHVPLITALHPGVLTVIRGGKRTYYAVSTGFAEIENDKVTVLTDACEESSNIDLAAAHRALHEAEDKLKALAPDEPSYAEQKRRLDQAGARIDAAQRRG